MFWQSPTEFIGRWWSFWRRWTARSIGWCRPEVRGSRWTCSKSNLKNHQSDRFISGSGLPGCTAAEWTTRSYRGIPAWTRGWAPSKRPVDGTADTPPKSRPTNRQIIMNCNWLNRPEAFFFLFRRSRSTLTEDRSAGGAQHIQVKIQASILIINRPHQIQSN